MVNWHIAGWIAIFPTSLDREADSFQETFYGFARILVVLTVLAILVARPLATPISISS
jgi:hypothetical protein